MKKYDLAHGKKYYREQAAHELGITSRDHIVDPGKMILTTEQRAALEWAMKLMGDCGAAKEIAAILSQSQPAWEITEERQETLTSMFDLIECTREGRMSRATEEQLVTVRGVLRAMLDEVPK